MNLRLSKPLERSIKLIFYWVLHRTAKAKNPSSPFHVLRLLLIFNYNSPEPTVSKFLKVSYDIRMLLKK